MYHYAANNPVRYVDPDGRETYDSKITEEQYNNSYFLQQLMSWECVQSYFDENPNGVLHRPADQISFMQLGSKSDVVNINDGSMLMVDAILVGNGLVSIGKTLATIVGKNLAKKAAIEFTTHGAIQAAERGFTKNRITQVLTKGAFEITSGRYELKQNILWVKTLLLLQMKG